jgi:LPXTG-motif cell wall-anchored protein
VANTGGNTVAAGAGVPLDADSQKVVDDIAAALSAFLDQIDAAAAGRLDPGSPLRLTLSIGDVTIDVDASLAGALIGVDAGASATVRQVTAIFNIGVTRASSGDNVAVVTGDRAAQVAALATVAEQQARRGGSLAVRITTGDALAQNRSSAITICQVDDVSPAVCVQDVSPDGGEVPTPTPTPTTPAQPSGLVLTPGQIVTRPITERPAARPAHTARGSLPATGANSIGLAVAASMLVLVGGGLVLVSRRRVS